MELSPVAMRAFAGLLKDRTGQELAASRHWRIETALKPLLRDRELPSFDSLAAGLADRRDIKLADAVVEALLNHETFFFREQAAFNMLMAGPVEALAAARGGTRRLRIWCAGCSTGQEAYSIAMAFADAGDRWRAWTVEIIGTDVSASIVGRAVEGCYSQFEIQRGLPVRQMMRWFTPDGDDWRANADLRRMVRFERHNLLDPAPFPGTADIILCRNVLLYFAAEERTRVFDGLAATIAGDGCLMLGAGETVLGNTTRFEPDAAQRGFYRPVA
ncbi:chemotaxis protein methyltransferase CheR [Sphingomonas laterariae]|uniref:Chemotaxis protein methyltransferase CheR n=1 Tax=Edaphosphingomonas laterariae TaxID=861865 RepID=A0A239E536_9SPHN|nr:protein-glutamate O-methyltransferase CheR [Sphingomonas laterariae]SNS39541.1 chemotaxis protein methyltransferase CheR [Sphingomonas laterariae]